MPCGRVRRSEILTGGDALDGAATGGCVVFVLLDQRADVDDAFALLARDLRPVVGVGGVRQVFVLLELLRDRRNEVGGADAARLTGDLSFDRQLLGATDDV